jgi:SM-20-related protein
MAFSHDVFIIALMQPQFEALVETYLANTVGQTNQFLTDVLSHQMKDHLELLFASDQMRNAGTGNEKTILKDKLVRSDQIHWLDRAHPAPHEVAFFATMDAFVLFLNQTCYTGITGYEFHYARYAEGAFYTRHLDQFRNESSRKFSMIMYLNEGWLPAHGGELCIHHHDHTQHIAPEFGKAVFFKSNELEHEVLLAHKTRMSITGWLKG